MMEQARLCAVWPMEEWLGSSLNQIQGWTIVRESFSRALEQGSLQLRVTLRNGERHFFFPAVRKNVGLISGYYSLAPI